MRAAGVHPAGHPHQQRPNSTSSVTILKNSGASFPATVESRHLLHIAATRATHQLWLVSTNVVPELLREASGRFAAYAQAETGQGEVDHA